MRGLRELSTAALTVAAIASQTLNSQVIKAITLAPASGRLTAEFDGMTSIRELADGRAIVTDGGGQQLYVADFKTDSVSTLGRKGKGPGEWAHVGLVYGIGRDSTIMQDMDVRRWLLFDGGKIVGTVPPDHAAIKASNSLIHGADSFGHVMIKTLPIARNGETVFTRKDSNAIVLINRASGHVDTIAKVRTMPRITTANVDSLGRLHGLSSKPTDANPQEEDAILTQDGWLAVVRVEPLRIDWRSPDGEWTKGAALPIKPDVVDAKERRLIQKRYAENVAAAKARLRLPVAPPMIPEKYNVLDKARGQFIASDGRLILRRTSTGANPAHRYLVINRRGVLDGQFNLGENENIIGFGAKYLYVSSKDDDDVQTLRRHSWP